MMKKVLEALKALEAKAKELDSDSKGVPVRSKGGCWASCFSGRPSKETLKKREALEARFNQLILEARLCTASLYEILADDKKSAYVWTSELEAIAECKKTNLYWFTVLEENGVDRASLFFSTSIRQLRSIVDKIEQRCSKRTQSDSSLSACTTTACSSTAPSPVQEGQSVDDSEQSALPMPVVVAFTNHV